MAVDGNVDPNFTIVMRGYEREEVDSYLRDLVAETSRLGERVTQLEADLESARARSEARTSPEEGFKQLGEETTRVLVAAETAAREMREKAERQADAEVAAAEKAARERVENASDHADRIVAEAEARQRDVEAEIRRLEDVRSELVDRLRGAISSTEQAIGSIPSADAAPGPTTAESASARSDQRDQPPFEAAEARAEPGPGGAAQDVEDAAAPVAQAAEVGLPETESETEAATETDTAGDEALAAAAPVETGALATSDEDDADAEDAEDAAEVASAPGEVATRAPADESHGGADRNALEAALAEADAAAGRAPAAEARTEEADAEMLRERSLAGVRPGMLRRLRRSLQELQNGVLESVRTRKQDAEVDDLLPSSPEAAGLADVARVFLDAGYRAGRADAPVLTGGESLQDPPTDSTLVADTADGLAEELLDQLRTTLAPSLRAGVDADEPDASLSERVGEVFRDLKGPIVETVVDRHLARTYGRATLDGWADEGVEKVRWVVGEETRCPESICRGNEAEGALALGSDFPSGHAVPPAHDGCTCALGPV